MVVGLAALVAAGIAFATLCPIEWRPHLAGANAERFAAFFALGALTALAAGRRGLAATAAVVAIALASEAGQMLAPSRHAELSDALVKATGAVCGVAAAQTAFALRRSAARAFAWWERRRKAAPATVARAAISR